MGVKLTWRALIGLLAVAIVLSGHAVPDGASAQQRLTPEQQNAIMNQMFDNINNPKKCPPGQRYYWENGQCMTNVQGVCAAGCFQHRFTGNCMCACPPGCKWNFADKVCVKSKGRGRCR